MIDEKHVGTKLDDLLRDEGIFDKIAEEVMKRFSRTLEILADKDNVALQKEREDD